MATSFPWQSLYRSALRSIDRTDTRALHSARRAIRERLVETSLKSSDLAEHNLLLIAQSDLNILLIAIANARGDERVETHAIFIVWSAVDAG